MHCCFKLLFVNANQTREEYNAYMRVYMLARYHERMLVARMELGGKCSRCPCRTKLQFDHINPGKKKFTIAKLWSLAERTFWNEIAKCQLLCGECHTAKTLKELGRKPARGTHGTISAYRYCGPPKCEACRMANNEVSRKWRERNKHSRPGSLVV